MAKKKVTKKKPVKKTYDNKRGVKKETYMTAITRSSLSAPVKWLKTTGRLGDKKILDYGCGKGTDAELLKCSKYDPYYSPTMPGGKFDTILCTYVLNTIKENSQKLAVINDIQFRLKKRNAVAYVTVRNDVKEAGYTSKGTWQEPVRLNIPVVRKTTGYVTYLLTPEDKVKLV